MCTCWDILTVLVAWGCIIFTVTWIISKHSHHSDSIKCPWLKLCLSLPLLWRPFLMKCPKFTWSICHHFFSFVFDRLWNGNQPRIQVFHCLQNMFNYYFKTHFILVFNIYVRAKPAQGNLLHTNRNIKRYWATSCAARKRERERKKIL